jgi:hypothetical protein
MVLYQCHVFRRAIHLRNNIECNESFPVWWRSCIAMANPAHSPLPKILPSLVVQFVHQIFLQCPFDRAPYPADSIRLREDDWRSILWLSRFQNNDALELVKILTPLEVQHRDSMNGIRQTTHKWLGEAKQAIDTYPSLFNVMSQLKYSPRHIDDVIRNIIKRFEWDASWPTNASDIIATAIKSDNKSIVDIVCEVAHDRFTELVGTGIPQPSVPFLLSLVSCAWWRILPTSSLSLWRSIVTMLDGPRGLFQAAATPSAIHDWIPLVNKLYQCAIDSRVVFTGMQAGRVAVPRSGVGIDPLIEFGNMISHLMVYLSSYASSLPPFQYVAGVLQLLGELKVDIKETGATTTAILRADTSRAARQCPVIDFASISQVFFGDEKVAAAGARVCGVLNDKLFGSQDSQYRAIVIAIIRLIQPSINRLHVANVGELQIYKNHFSLLASMITNPATECKGVATSWLDASVNQLVKSNEYIRDIYHPSNLLPLLTPFVIAAMSPASSSTVENFQLQLEIKLNDWCDGKMTYNEILQMNPNMLRLLYDHTRIPLATATTLMTKILSWKKKFAELRTDLENRAKELATLSNYNVEGARDMHERLTKLINDFPNLTSSVIGNRSKEFTL